VVMPVLAWVWCSNVASSREMISPEQDKRIVERRARVRMRNLEDSTFIFGLCIVGGNTDCTVVDDIVHRHGVIGHRICALAFCTSVFREGKIPKFRGLLSVS